MQTPRTTASKSIFNSDLAIKAAGKPAEQTKLNDDDFDDDFEDEPLDDLDDDGTRYDDDDDDY
ncbi:hypothetical protein [Mucilaginibacter sp. CSA2-8R]|uniref:hypothetical protein n=1 Tax=Mucilaginibacter sp. CSA2-8R TaxID=3141542 RepID=UPI00315CD473